MNSTNAISQKLIATLEYVTNKSPFYKRHFAHLAFPQTYEEFKKLPFTQKDDLANFNDDFRCIELQDVAEYVTTSGTSGAPVSLFLSRNDLQRLAANEKASFQLVGAQKGDLFQLMTTIDKQFMAGMAYYLGSQALEAGIIRIGPGVPQLQWDAILKYKPTYIIAVPSFLVTLIAYAKQKGIDLHQTSVKAAICIGEAIREDDLTPNVLGKRILESWPIELYSTYASTEMAAAFTECGAHAGGHQNESLIHLEVLDEAGNEVGDQESGEIVVTTLGVEGTPLVRYRTGDVAKIYRKPCSCGRTSPRLGPILGRKNQMIKFKGTTLYPNAIYEIFDGVDAISCYKIEVSKDELNHDVITVLLEKAIEYSEVLTEIRELCKAKLRVVPHFVFLETEYLRSQVYKNHMRKPEKIVFK